MHSCSWLLPQVRSRATLVSVCSSPSRLEPAHRGFAEYGTDQMSPLPSQMMVVRPRTSTLHRLQRHRSHHQKLRLRNPMHGSQSIHRRRHRSHHPSGLLAKSCRHPVGCRSLVADSPLRFLRLTITGQTMSVGVQASGTSAPPHPVTRGKSAAIRATSCSSNWGVCCMRSNASMPCMMVPLSALLQRSCTRV